jgi:1,4-dihydroxy-6-naphthoate synthase
MFAGAPQHPWRPPISAATHERNHVRIVQPGSRCRRAQATLSSVQTIKLAFSPDSDDLFMFWPLLARKIAHPKYDFEHHRADTESLNREAANGRLDVVAVSIARYPALASQYLLLPHGGSVGRGYGPAVVAPAVRTLESLRGKRIAIPGFGTTAYLVTRLLLSEFEPVVVPIQPYARVFETLRRGEVDAALLIHEGRLTFEREGFAMVADIGERWAALTGGLPLPLGGNVIRRALGSTVIAEISNLLRESVRWALEHRAMLLDELAAAEQREDVGLTRGLLDRYLAMYANTDTLGYPEDAQRAVEELLRRGAAAGLLPPDARVEWSP